jgi:hypothetical protein
MATLHYIAAMRMVGTVELTGFRLRRQFLGHFFKGEVLPQKIAPKDFYWDRALAHSKARVF